jgi:hypothetical protein
MVKWLTAASFSALLWFAIFIIVRGIGTDLITFTGLSVFVLVPVTVGILIGCIDRFVAERNSWSGRIFDLNSRRRSQDVLHIDRLRRRRARMDFLDWKPGQRVTIH